MKTHPNARLTPRNVKAIRAAYKRANGKRGVVSELGRKYAVSPSTICEIVKGYTWKEVR